MVTGGEAAKARTGESCLGEAWTGGVGMGKAGEDWCGQARYGGVGIGTADEDWCGWVRSGLEMQQRTGWDGRDEDGRGRKGDFER